MMSDFSDEEDLSDEYSDSQEMIFEDDFEGGFEGGFALLQDSELDNLMESLQLDRAKNVGNTEVVLDDSIWSSFPEELLDKSLTWLPLATLFRFRCVCKRWEALFSSAGWLQHFSQVAESRPTCTIMCPLGYREADFFCHTELKWFKVPLGPVSYLELDWEVADTDAGLICYQCNWKGDLWLCVCNPLTQSSKVLPPNYPHWDILDAQPSNCELVKLVVDKVAKTFKVVVLVHSSSPPTTVVYDSTTSLWTVCQSFPSLDLRSGTFFVWKNAIYSQCFQPNLLLAFGFESGVWSEVETDLPCHLIRRHYLVNHNGSQLLVQMDIPVEEPILIWRLVEDTPSSSSASSSTSKWVKLTISIEPYLRRLLGDVHSCFTQSDCICFGTAHTNKWISYSFGTKCWRVMPSRGRRITPYAWFEWEPRFDIDVESDPLNESE